MEGNLKMNSLGLALVTGASRGIGAAIAEKLALDGFKVLINYQSSEAKALEVKQRIEAKGGQADVLGFDVGDDAQVSEAFKKIANLGDPLRVLVNNAGISRDQLILRLDPQDLLDVLRINLVGAVFCSKEAAKLMLKQRQGSIVQISSVVGEMGNAGQTAYAASKAGLIGVTKSLAKELASRSIRVNCVTPGYIETEMTDALTPQQKEAIVKNIPLGTLGQASDVASLVAFLAGPQSCYMTGQVLGVNGGLYI
jgi:3-oxoacyl-[acyl-carrier protein] reductase